MLRKVKPYSFYYGVSVLLLIVGAVAQLFQVPAGIVLAMFALLCALYGMELHKDIEQQSNARKITLWLCASVISALVFAPLLR